MKIRVRLFYLAVCLLVSVPFVVSSCDDDDEETPSNMIQMQNTTINGAQEVPANTSQATGTFAGTYDTDTKMLTYTITYTGITPTNMHFHKGAVGVSGPVVIPITVGPSPINGKTAALTPEQEADLLAGLYYVNIHSQQVPLGEIRGQVLRR